MLNRQALNLAANFSGVGARLIFSLAFNIVYFRLLGSEGYGLVGFYTSLAALSSLFDLGLNQTTVREVGRRGGEGESAGELPAVVFTLQFVLAGIGCTVGLLVALGSYWTAANWFSMTQLATREVATSIALMGGVLALLFPTNFFYATLAGLQRQVLSNAIIVTATALRGALTVIALVVFGSSPPIFFCSQIIASAIEAVVLGFVVWERLPPSPRPRFDAALLGSSWEFSSGTWLAVMFAQIAVLGDKIILSTLLPLHQFGLYSLAVTVTSTIQRLAAPFTNSYFPHFVRLKETDRPDTLIATYRQASEFASAIFLAAGLSVMAYAQPIAHLLSSGDAEDTGRLGSLLLLLAAANTLSVEMALPFSLQFAYGITATALRINLALCLLYPTALVLLVPHFGMEAAAALWLAANAVMLPILIVMTHRLILPGQAWPWLVRVMLMPGSGAAVVLAAGAAIMPDLGRVPMLAWIGLNGVLALAAALICAPEARQTIFARLGRRGSRDS
jgi:O-antigen/teichoic acid export membrane protein